MATDPSVVEVDLICGLEPDKADRELAWQVLWFTSHGYRSCPWLTYSPDLIAHINNALRQIALENFYRVGGFGHFLVYDRISHLHRAATTVQKALNAIFTIADFGCSLWPTFRNDDRFKISTLYLPIDAPAWSGFAASMGLALFIARLAALPAESAQPEPEPRLVGPTWREVGLAKQSRTARRAVDGEYMADGLSNGLLNQQRKIWMYGPPCLTAIATGTP